jgi:hypothetical protein
MKTLGWIITAIVSLLGLIWLASRVRTGHW